MRCTLCGWSGGSEEITRGVCPQCHEGGGLEDIMESITQDLVAPGLESITIQAEGHAVPNPFTRRKRVVLRWGEIPRCRRTECLCNVTPQLYIIVDRPFYGNPRCTANAAELVPDSPKCPKYIKAERSTRHNDDRKTQ